MAKQRVFKFTGFMLFVAFFVFAASGGLLAKEVKFKAVSFLPKGNPTIKAFEMIVNDFNQKFKGEAFINWAGGPEVIPAFQLHEAVRSGAIDMCATSCSFYSAVLPVSHSIMYSNKTHKEIQDSGFFDIFSGLHKKAGFIYLGEMAHGRPFYMFSNFHPKTPADIAGKKIRVFPAISPLVKALGAAPVLMHMPEIYTAMERGVVDGFVMTTIGFVKGFSWHEVTKYMIEPGFYRGSVAWLANPKKWGQLSKDLQDRIIDWKYNDFDPKAEAFLMKQGKGQTQLVYNSKKTQVITFSPSDNEAYLKLIYNSAWDVLAKKSPDTAPKLKALLVK